tara:strand:+ start:44 stop:499 length:456 start_codon:yes stop_codon:yes gene_type:complete
MKDLNFNLQISNEKDYIIYFFESKINPLTGETYQPTNNDIHTWKIMTENFIENCKVKNSRFCFIFNLHTVSSLPLSFIIDICGFFMKYNSFFKQKLIANCFIMENDKIQNLINLFLRYYKPVKPIKFFKNINECKKYIKDSSLSNSKCIND